MGMEEGVGRRQLSSNDDLCAVSLGLLDRCR